VLASRVVVATNTFLRAQNLAGGFRAIQLPLHLGIHPGNHQLAASRLELLRVALQHGHEAAADAFLRAQPQDHYRALGTLHGRQLRLDGFGSREGHVAENLQQCDRVAGDFGRHWAFVDRPPGRREIWQGLLLWAPILCAMSM